MAPIFSVTHLEVIYLLRSPTPSQNCLHRNPSSNCMRSCDITFSKFTLLTRRAGAEWHIKGCKLKSSDSWVAFRRHMDLIRITIRKIENQLTAWKLLLHYALDWTLTVSRLKSWIARASHWETPLSSDYEAWLSGEKHDSYLWPT